MALPAKRVTNKFACDGQPSKTTQEPLHAVRRGHVPALDAEHVGGDLPCDRHPRPAPVEDRARLAAHAPRAAPTRVAPRHTHAAQPRAAAA